MRFVSSAFHEGGSIPSQYTCDGENINPEFIIYGPPEGTKSFALVVDDPDSPTGIWIHWVVWNISPETKTIYADKVPENAEEGITSFGKRRYGGPCPGGGEHRYFFRIFALDTMLRLNPADLNVKELERAIKGHVLGTAETMGRYHRRQSMNK